MPNLNIVNDSGQKFDVRVVDTGDTYGLHDDLINDGDPIVEFYDVGQSNFPNGQFVSSYYVSTLIYGYNPDNCSGLNLSGGVPEWYIDGSNMSEVVEFLKGLK